MSERRLGIDPRRDGSDRLNLAEVFGNDHPVTLEIGSGKGRFLLEAGSSAPERNFLGIEKSLHYFRVIVDRLERAGLENVRVINHDAHFVIAKMIPDATVADVHIYFPDPWPRPRERKRRIIRSEVLREIDRILVSGGSGLYVTDHREYFEKSVPLFEEWFAAEGAELDSSVEARTNYEAKYREEGRPIYQIVFMKRNAAEGQPSGRP
jgi:tRNA (guanine-N7-)-methyltransferase